MKKIKKLPNYITLLRILGTIIIIFLDTFSPEFFIFYILCGLSDVLDGYIARKLSITSKSGARLDSIADTFFVLSIILKILPRLKLELWIILWIIFIVAIRVIALVILFIRFRERTFLHTYLNKISGLVLFLLPLFYILLGLNISIVIVCVIANLSALEELFINIITKKENLDIKGIHKIFSKEILK